MTDTKINETDAAGYCETTYTQITDTKIRKLKENCVSPDFPYWKNPEKLFATNVQSLRIAEYEVTSHYSCFKSVVSKDKHDMFIALKEDSGVQVTSGLSLRVVEESKVGVIDGENIDEVLLSLIEKEGGEYVEETLLTERELQKSEKKLSKVVEELRENLKPEALGTVESAKGFVKLIDVSRASNKEDVAKVLSAKKNQKIL